MLLSPVGPSQTKLAVRSTYGEAQVIDFWAADPKTGEPRGDKLMVWVKGGMTGIGKNDMIPQ